MNLNWWKPINQRNVAISAPRNSAARPSLSVKFTSSLDLLIGRKLLGLHAARWTSDVCNLAMFAYDIEGLGAFVLPERVAAIHEFECWFVELNSHFTSLHRVDASNVDDPRLFGCRITDLLVPRLRDDRVPDSQVLMLSSGFGLAQESGTPHGILPSLMLVPPEALAADLVSIQIQDQ